MKFIKIIIFFSFVQIQLNAQVFDIDGNRYKTIKIGNQVWMAENLRTTHYNDGSEIYELIGKDAVNYGCFKRVGNNKKDIGYNGYVAMSNKIAPKGWHVPSLKEYATLAFFLGDKVFAKLKSENGWKPLIIEAHYDTKTCENCSYWSQEQKRYNYCSFCRNTRQVNDKFIPREVQNRNGKNSSGFNAKPFYGFTYDKDNEKLYEMKDVKMDFNYLTLSRLWEDIQKFWSSTNLNSAYNLVFDMHSWISKNENKIGDFFGENNRNNQSMMTIQSILPIRCIKDDDAYISESLEIINKKTDEKNDSQHSFAEKRTSRYGNDMNSQTANSNPLINWENCVERMLEDSFVRFKYLTQQFN
ncbi:MAG: hypothetical protein NTY72_12695 [Bacteroidetes bacterium]|nr:hypothetical protein [Bacteroidota bacterium]